VTREYNAHVSRENVVSMWPSKVNDYYTILRTICLNKINKKKKIIKIAIMKT
jgi:hypothetical protein